MFFLMRMARRNRRNNNRGPVEAPVSAQEQRWIADANRQYGTTGGASSNYGLDKPWKKVAFFVAFFGAILLLRMVAVG